MTPELTRIKDKINKAIDKIDQFDEVCGEEERIDANELWRLLNLLRRTLDDACKLLEEVAP